MTESHGSARARPVSIRAGGVTLHGDLAVPEHARALVLFAHGSGSSRRSPRNRYVAGVLREARLATLLFDLLTAREETEDKRTARLRFDIDLLAARLVGATDWAVGEVGGMEGGMGYFGASTGAAAALIAAAERSALVAAVVSRGGRPDLSGAALPHVRAPTLLLVGALDREVLALNEAARAAMMTTVSLQVVPNAGHLFEEPGALERVSALARDWFMEHSAVGAD